MSFFSTDLNPGALSAAEVSELITVPLAQAGICTAVSTLLVMDDTSPSYRMPIVTEDASAGWVAEGAEIPTSEPTTSELVLIPRKLAALTYVSREMANDASPQDS